MRAAGQTGQVGQMNSNDRIAALLKSGRIFVLVLGGGGSLFVLPEGEKWVVGDYVDKGMKNTRFRVGKKSV